MVSLLSCNGRELLLQAGGDFGVFGDDVFCLPGVGCQVEEFEAFRGLFSAVSSEMQVFPVAVSQGESFCSLLNQMVASFRAGFSKHGRHYVGTV